MLQYTVRRYSRRYLSAGYFLKPFNVCMKWTNRLMSDFDRSLGSCSHTRSAQSGIQIWYCSLKSSWLNRRLWLLIEERICDYILWSTRIRALTHMFLNWIKNPFNPSMLPKRKSFTRSLGTFLWFWLMTVIFLQRNFAPLEICWIFSRRDSSTIIMRGMISSHLLSLKRSSFSEMTVTTSLMCWPFSTAYCRMRRSTRVRRYT